MIYFITGGSRGIGAGVVLDAVERGHDVAFTYVNNEARAREIEEDAKRLNPDVRCKAYKLDVRDVKDVERVGDQVIEDFESVDVVVNNAGISRDQTLVGMSDDEWDDVIATNLSGPFYVCRYFIMTMVGNRFGRIINLSSLSAYGASGQSNYAAAKSGLHGLTQSIAKEYGRKGITANVVVPGFFETDMTREHLPEHMRQFWQKWCPVPKGRIGDIKELSATIHFLASKEASYINGQILNVTGSLDWSP
ncbi:MAG: SDR family oxidoreductase [Myxococcales bacterium]|nr:SDR family oxidoreductase [Myxococcales bacterium]MCB9643878.1 SDR family oxidoreductase [Myxococcales bacterium]